ncbi:hypothetical protein HOLleu_11433 [Holothuria leucospilota]|uniref:Uncharacterized protein n=1 Tax=Holothuria leucospilota TaxID=206669 RepID=A0A9Q1HF56_HOLLE|nr:hypothetical protein HOLleu_11433 [Holothuria leucospilota]
MAAPPGYIIGVPMGPFGQPQFMQQPRMPMHPPPQHHQHPQHQRGPPQAMTEEKLQEKLYMTSQNFLAVTMKSTC